MRDELKAYTFMKPREDSRELDILKELYDGLIKKGDHEKFYGKLYSQVPLHAVKYFPGLSRNAATLLSTKLADRRISHSKEKLSLPDKELAGMQYLGGYVLHNLHNKIANQRKVNFLKASKPCHF